MKRVLFIILTVGMLLCNGCGSKLQDEGSVTAAEENTQTAQSDAQTIQDDAQTARSDAQTAEDGDGKSDGEKSQVAQASDMAEVIDVVEEGMVPVTADALRDGTYPIAVDSSSSMFQIVSAELTVENGQMRAAMTMGGTGYGFVYMGTGEAAAAASENDYISYEENAEGSHVFTVPVKALDEGIACAAYSKKKEMWYDRTLVFRADSLPLDAFGEGEVVTAESLQLADGEYTVDVTLAGGSGKASVESPARLAVKDGEAYATIVWSSKNYDYMLVDDKRYDNENPEGNSTFEIPVAAFDRRLKVVGDTTAMSTPYEIAYTLYFASESIQ